MEWNDIKHTLKGCARCNNTGYRGRVGIYELMVTDDRLIEAINRGKESAEIKQIAVKSGIKTLHQDSLLKVKVGVTTLPEALSTVPFDL